MTVSGVKVIRLSEEEKSLLTRAGRLLGDLADQIDGFGEDDDLVMELNRAYDTCLDVVREEKFEYVIDDGNE